MHRITAIVIIINCLLHLRVDGQPINGFKKVALIANYYAVGSHANALASKFFTGFPTDEGLIPPSVKIVSMWIDQVSPDSTGKVGARDVGRHIAKLNGVPVYSSIEKALTLGGDTLAVDAVIYIGEHGDYPRSRLGVKMYPRLNVMEQIFRVFDASKKVVPVFSDKALAYSWLDAKWIYDRSKELGVPLMAGSVIPYSWRDPMLQHPLGSKIKEAVAVGYGALDSYGFHVAEILQSMLERRQGGETGVASVQGLRGAAVWQAVDDGVIPVKLLNEACNVIKGNRSANMREVVKEPYAIIIKYNDGTSGSILILNGYVGEGWGYAANVDSKTQACEFVLEPGINSHFSYLGLNIQRFFESSKLPAPLERTLLTSGILDRGIRSIQQGGKILLTPELNIKYKALDYSPIVPLASRPKGQSIGPWPPRGYDFIVDKPVK
jgi:hypothetical protein